MVADTFWRHCRVLGCAVVVCVTWASQTRAEATRAWSPGTLKLSAGSTRPPDSGVLERVPTASWAMGCAAGAALAAHAVYQSLSDRRRARLNRTCAGYCPEYRIDHYQETRRKAEVALHLGVLAGASALWLLYNDPEEALEHMQQGQPPSDRRRGLQVKLKPEKQGVWASLVAHF